MRIVRCLGPILFLLPTALGAAPDREIAKGYVRLGFDVLGGFAFAAPSSGPWNDSAKPTAEAEKAQESAVRKQIPERIQQLDGKKAIVTGFMLPMKFDSSGRVVEFLLVRDQTMCCYGTIPDPNAWVSVHMEKPVPAVMDEPTSLEGILHVGPVFADGFLTAIYSFDGEKMVAGPTKL